MENLARDLSPEARNLVLATQARPGAPSSQRPSSSSLARQARGGQKDADVRHDHLKPLGRTARVDIAPLLECSLDVRQRFDDAL